ncbi:VOC family protein [Pseudoroseomonas globiformis]|uniref:VOC family protein n=1 Tax=Teichococcus globiformis TaxID=2307229 RepID=A0ABV7FXS6_9PROT
MSATASPLPEAAPLSVAGITLAARDIATLSGFYAALLGTAAEPDTAAPGALRFPLRGATLRLLPAPGAKPEQGSEPGLFHTAFLLPDRRALSGWLHHALGMGVRLQGASDHGVSEALYLADPEGNGIEVYFDRPRGEWPRDEQGGVAMFTHRLDLRALLEDTNGPALAAEATRIGHVHLRGGNIPATEAFYRSLGFAVMHRRPQASFLATGGYHHHLAVNGWNSSGVRPAGLAGLAELALRASGPSAPRVAQAMQAAQPEGEGLWAVDPSGNRIRLEASE